MVNSTETRIDTHAHLGESPFVGVPEATPLYFEGEEFSHTRFLVMPFEARSNAAVLRQVTRHPRFLGMYLMFNPNEAHQFWTEADKFKSIEELMTRRYVVGIKSHSAIFRIRIDDPRYFPYYQAAQRHGMPVLLHAASSGQDFNSAEMTRRVLDSFPDLKIILAHFGGLRPKYMEEAVKLAEECPRLYLDTSAMHQIGAQRRVNNTSLSRETVETDPREIAAMKKATLDIFVGFSRTKPQQILFGSDLGWLSPEEYSIWPVDQLDRDLARMIFIKNPTRLFGTNMKQ